MDLLEVYIGIGVPLVLILLGLVFGGQAERRHLRRLRAREAELSSVLVTQMREYLAPLPSGKPPKLIMAETVISSDYLKTFLAGLKNIFGGEVRSFQTLLERGRREVTVQLRRQAAAEGYNAICNVRLNTANVGGLSAKAIAMATVMGWATAYDSSLAPPQERAGDPGFRAPDIL